MDSIFLLRNSACVLHQEQDALAVEIMTPVRKTISKVLYNLLWVYNPTRIVVDSSRYGQQQNCITEHFQTFLEDMKNDGIPIHAEIRAAKYDEYHMMRGCFYMTRNAWIEETADSIQGRQSGQARRGFPTPHS